MLHAVQRGIQRPFRDVQRVVSGVFQPTRDPVTVSWAPGEGLENEEVKRALQEFAANESHQGVRVYLD